MGVIFSTADLARALRLRRPPDLFELRLDGLIAAANQLPEAILKLGAPIIITARSPTEGGSNNLSLARRRELLLRFLSHAAFIDVELRCATAFSAVLKFARAENVPVIFSFHALRTTPSLRALLTAARRAHSLGGNIFKIAARTDRPDQLRRLIELVNSTSVRIPISAMGIGRLGRASRAQLARAGSVLNYAHLGHPTIEGQWSLAQLRAALDQPSSRKRRRGARPIMPYSRGTVHAVSSAFACVYK